MTKQPRTMTFERILFGKCDWCGKEEVECVEIASQEQVFEGLNRFTCLKKMIRRSIETVKTPEATPLEIPDESFEDTGTTRIDPDSASA